jgi:hypothetical protein
MVPGLFQITPTPQWFEIFLIVALHPVFKYPFSKCSLVALHIIYDHFSTSEENNRDQYVTILALIYISSG